MKKIIVLILLLAILVISGIEKKGEFSFASYFDYGELTIFRQSSGEVEILPNITTYKNDKAILGESMFFENVEVDTLLKTLSANILCTEQVVEENLTILYCYSPNIPKIVSFNNFNINLQVATTDDYTVIGWPMILGSF